MRRARLWRLTHGPFVVNVHRIEVRENGIGRRRFEASAAFRLLTHPRGAMTVLRRASQPCTSESRYLTVLPEILMNGKPSVFLHKRSVLGSMDSCNASSLSVNNPFDTGLAGLSVAIIFCMTHDRASCQKENWTDNGNFVRKPGLFVQFIAGLSRREQSHSHLSGQAAHSLFVTGEHGLVPFV